MSQQLRSVFIVFILNSNLLQPVFSCIQGYLYLLEPLCSLCMNRHYVQGKQHAVCDSVIISVTVLFPAIKGYIIS